MISLLNIGQESKWKNCHLKADLWHRLSSLVSPSHKCHLIICHLRASEQSGYCETLGATKLANKPVSCISLVILIAIGALVTVVIWTQSDMLFSHYLPVMQEKSNIEVTNFSHFVFRNISDCAHPYTHMHAIFVNMYFNHSNYL